MSDYFNAVWETGQLIFYWFVLSCSALYLGVFACILVQTLLSAAKRAGKWIGNRLFRRQSGNEPGVNWEFLKSNAAIFCLGAAIVLAAAIYAFSNRYQFINRARSTDVILDRWTGKAEPFF